MPRLGMGTWHMGESPASRPMELAALRLGLELGLRLVDTAEMYGEGGAEEVVGEALRGRRDGVFVVTKFYPHHAARKDLVAACERSRRRLGVDTIDCYLLHWRGSVPLAETVDTLNELTVNGRIASWGVSNFDTADMQELFSVPGGSAAVANQVLYNLARRGAEFDLLPWCAASSVDVMAYSPLDEGPLARHPALLPLAKARGVSAAQLAIAWTLARPGVACIPKAAKESHVRANAAAAAISLDTEVLAALDHAFPPPTRKRPLEVI
jgi:diketogulonate reductase-like aldo/keto reductase